MQAERLLQPFRRSLPALTPTDTRIQAFHPIMNSPCSSFSAPLHSGRPFSWRPLFVSLFVAPVLLPAQVQPAVADAAVLTRYDANKNGRLDADELKRKEADEAALRSDVEAQVLSPFEVRTDKDDGFSAIAAGDGTRLGLDMRDMPASYLAITRDFMDALAITDLQGASSWATNSGVTVDPQGSDSFPNVGGFLQRFRGITVAGGQQRDFYNNPGTMDSYSLERIDFGRGPNAALFNPGLLTGSGENALAGAQSAQSKRARIGQSFETLRVRYGSWDYYRGEIDINRTITDKLAVRANGVMFDRNGWRRGEFEKVHGVAFGGTYRMAEKTEIRFSANSDTTRRNNPGLDVWDQISGWDGLTVFNGPITNLQLSGNATPGAALGNGRTLTFNGEPQGVSRRGGIYYVFVPGASMVMNRQNEGTTRRGDETNRTPLYGDNGAVFTRNGVTAAFPPAAGAFLPIGNGGSQGTTASPTSNPDTNIDFREAINLPGSRFDRAIANSFFRLPGRDFAITTGTPLFTQWNKDANVAFTRQLGRSWFIEVGLDYNTTHNRHLPSLTGGWARTQIDLNQLNPDGTANPYYLQPYNDANLRQTHRYIQNKSFRANLAHNRDLGKWGSYQFSLNMGRTMRDTKHEDFFASMGLQADPRMAVGADDQLRYRFYWNNPDMSYDLATLPTTVFRRNFAADNNSWTTSTQTFTPKWVPLNWNMVEEKIDYIALATAARFLDNKLVFLFSPRFDRYYNHTRQNPIYGDLPADWNQQPSQIYKPDAPADFVSLTYDSITGTRGLAAATRPRLAGVNGVAARNPAYANFRFRDDYSPPISQGDKITGSYGTVYHVLPGLSALANFGSSYVTPLPGNFELGGGIVKPREGKGMDLALRSELLQRRLALKLTYFSNAEQNVRIDPPIKGPINSLLSRNAATDATTDGRNLRGVGDIVGTDYQSQKTWGWEFEVTGKFTKNWRILANVATNQVQTFNRYPQALKFLNENSDLFVQVLQDAGGMLDTTQHPNGAPGVAVVNPAITAAIPSERTNAVTDFNNIWTQAGVILNDRPLKTEDGVVINLNTDYTFDRTILKGLRIGTAVQWKGDQFIGYRTGDTVVDSSGNLVLVNPAGASDDNRIFFKMPVEVIATAGYRWKFKNRREIEFSLVVRNVLGGNAVYYAGSSTALRPPDGDVTNRSRESVPGRLGGFQVPRSYLLTTTVRF